jgi:hypothetical protein
MVAAQVFRQIAIKTDFFVGVYLSFLRMDFDKKWMYDEENGRMGD